jgi:hypothetical protein
MLVISVATNWRTALNGALVRATRFLMRCWRRDGDMRRLRRRAVGASPDTMP